MPSIATHVSVDFFKLHYRPCFLEGLGYFSKITPNNTAMLEAMALNPKPSNLPVEVSTGTTRKSFIIEVEPPSSVVQVAIRDNKASYIPTLPLLQGAGPLNL